MNAILISWFMGIAVLSGVTSLGASWLIARRQNGINIRIEGKLDVVHTLVNSDKTMALQIQHDGLVRELVLLRVVVDLHRNAGHEPTKEAVDEIGRTELQIADLEKLLAERLVQAETVKGQQERTAAEASR